MQIYIPLDAKNCYRINEKDDTLIFKIYNSSIEEYKYEDLLNYYKNPDITITELDSKTGYIINRSDELLFIPLYNTDNVLIDYTFSELKNYDLLSKNRLILSLDKRGKKYVKNKLKSMHEIVFGRKAREGYRLDHVDSNGLDNRSKKIREISSGANAANRVKKENTTSKYIGVSGQIIDSSFKGWIANISFERKQHYLGIFRNEIDAVKIRDVYAIYYYKEAAKLNRDENGDLFLSKDEINDIICNGIPEKYRISEKKIRELPECIYITGNRYYHGIYYRNIYYYKSFKTLNEAIEALAELKRSFRELEEREKREKEQNVTRNADGIAVLYTHDKAKNINGEFWVDDEIWKEFVHYSWYVTDGYASAYVNKFLNTLHNHVYIKYYGAIPKGMSIDHKKSDAKYDCRISNLRAATYSQQVQNADRSKHRKSPIKYIGIRIANGQFFAETRKNGETFQLGPYKTVEGAASGYNSLALEHHGPDAKINIIDNKETTFNNLFHKDNLTIQYLKQIETLGEINAVFYANEDWRLLGNVLLKKMKKTNLNKYIQIAIKLKERELS